MAPYPELPPHPRLRPLDIRWTQQDGRDALLLRDPLNLSGQTLLIPAPLAPLLSMMNGARDVGALCAAFLERAGFRMTGAQVQEVVDQLADALFLEDAAYWAARQQALMDFRSAAYRTPALADQVYPSDPAALARHLAGFSDGQSAADLASAGADVVGVITPHIDYHRGGKTYAQVWSRAAEAARQAECVIIFGTDHAGGPGLTLTRQNYATPWGVLPTDRAVVDDLAAALGEEQAFAEELNHRNEHSVELAAVWVHHVHGGKPCAVIPILCGSFAPYVDGSADPAKASAFALAVNVLRPLLASRRTLVVAAADLAHVGPVFGDMGPVSQSGRAQLASADQALLAAAASGDAAGFFQQVRNVEDRYRICGLPPMYLALRLIGAARGQSFGYDQCPADAEAHSLVSIAGVLLSRK